MAEPIHILFIDDDPDIQDSVSAYLTEQGAEVKLCKDGQSAIQCLKTQAVDIVLLDLMLGTEDGISVLRKIRDQNNVPVIMLSGRGESVDRVIGIEAGADDYIAKPFLPRELSARIAAVLRRSSPPSSQDKLESRNALISFDHWKLDREKYQVTDHDGNIADLSTGEFMVLDHLIMNKNKAVTRENLFKVLRAPDSDTFDRAVDIQITRIRHKLGDDVRSPKYIKTVRNVGYMFIADTKDMAA